MIIQHLNRIKNYAVSVNYTELLGDWSFQLSSYLINDRFGALMCRIHEVYKSKNHLYLPEKKQDLFKSLMLTQFKDLQVVILNCNPVLSKRYNGLAFGNKRSAVNDYDPELFHLFEEIETAEYNGVMIDKDFTLKEWADQGVLLLNVSLTSFQEIPKKLDWYDFMKNLLTVINDKKTGIIFCFIGGKPDVYSKLVNGNLHTCIFGSKLNYAMLNEINTNLEKINGKDYRIQW